MIPRETLELALEDALARQSGRLTAREREVAGLVAAGLTNKEIAAELQISPHTVDQHMRRVFGKLGVRRRGAVAGALLVLG